MSYKLHITKTQKFMSGQEKYEICAQRNREKERRRRKKKKPNTLTESLWQKHNERQKDRGRII